MSDETIANQTTIDRSLPEFIDLKETARRFYFSIGPGASTMCRKTIVGIHQEAIRFANKRIANLSFLYSDSGER